MTTVYNLCKKLIELGRTVGLQDKIDIYFANDRLSAEEYTEVVALLNAAYAETAETTATPTETA